MKKSLVAEKAFEFAVKVVLVAEKISNSKREFILTKQLIRSATSIGANCHEAEHAESKKDFIHKLSVALKEANETQYWLNLMKATNYLELNEFQELELLCTELIKMLTAIIKTSKQNLAQQ
jgi:four helix bundle protein